MDQHHHPSIHARTDPDLVACISAESGERQTYGALEAASNQVAHWFRGNGYMPGDSVVILCENSSRYYELVWGAHRAGLYYTPVSWHSTAEELSYIVKDSDARALLVSSRFSDIAVAATPMIEPSVERLSLFSSIPGFSDFDAACDQHDTSPITDEVSGREMLYTSGTTGNPKGVKFPLSGTTIETPSPGDWFYQREGYRPGAVVLAPGPAYHASPLLITMAAHRFGATVLVVDKFDAESTLQLIEQYRVTHFGCVPTHFVRLLKLPEAVRRRYDVSSVQWIVHTAAPCPVEVKQAMIEWFGPIIVEVYSGTERVGGSIITSEEWLKHPGSIGRAPNNSAHVVDESTWTECATGETGVIYFESDDDFSYHGDAAKTRSMNSPQGWKTLGDIGHIDADGYIYLTDRKSNVIITGGVNVYPQEAENRLISHPKVADAAVFGIPSDAFGEEVKAAVQLITGEPADNDLEEELISYCKATLSPLKCPRSIDFLEKLPREDNGKLYKQRLLERYGA